MKYENMVRNAGLMVTDWEHQKKSKDLDLYIFNPIIFLSQLPLIHRLTYSIAVLSGTIQY